MQKWQPITAKPNGGNGEKDKKKILKVGHFRNLFSKGVKNIIFFDNRVRKKNRIIEVEEAHFVDLLTLEEDELSEQS